MQLVIDSEALRAALAPALTAVGGELAVLVMKTATAIAEDMADGCMDKEAVRKYLGQNSVRTIENWMRPERDGGRGLPHMKIGETVLFLRSRVNAWLLSNERNAPPVVVQLGEAA